MQAQKSLLMELVEVIERHRQSVPPAVAPMPRAGRFRRMVGWFVPNGGTLLIVLILLMTQSLWAHPFQLTNAPGPSATTINYQGRLANNAGVPLDGSYGMSFGLWDAATGGNLVWGPESHDAVPVSEGLFSVGLGSRTAGGIPTNTWNGDRYLEITVGGETLTPRELLRSVPIAGMALTVPNGSISRDQLASDIESVLVETSGSYEATITVTEGDNPTVSPSTIQLDYKRVGSMVFISVPLFYLTISGDPHVIHISLPYPLAQNDEGGNGDITYYKGTSPGVISIDHIAFRNNGDGFRSGAFRGGFWYIAAP